MLLLGKTQKKHPGTYRTDLFSHHPGVRTGQSATYTSSPLSEATQANDRTCETAAQITTW